MQNLFIGKGNLGKPPEMKYLTNKETGEQFTATSMRVMFGRYGQNKNGEVVQIGGFWREVEIYGAKAEMCAKHLRRGARVLVIGKEIEFTAHDANDNEIQVLKIEAEDVTLQLSRIESITYSQPRGQEYNEALAEEAA